MKHTCMVLIVCLAFSAFSATGMQTADSRDGVGFVIVGTSITLIGTSAILFGGGMALLGDDMHGITQSVGTMILSVGAGIDCIGVPLLVIGVNKRERARFGVLLPPNRDGVGLRISFTM